jgi:hypothetical protein
MEQVTLGPDRIVDVIKPGGLYIDHTMNSPLLVRRVHDMLAARGVAMLDPVSGGMERRADAGSAGHGGRRAGRNWRSPAGEWVRTFAIITTAPNELCAELHNRMPVVLKPETWTVWLGEESADASALKALLVPYPWEEMRCWPVSPRVGNVKNNDPSLIEAIAA